MNYSFTTKQELYYIAPTDNLCSILQNGIFCHEEAEKRFPHRKRIENKRVYARRKQKGLSHYANLYINPRNPMLYQIYKGLKRKIVVIGIDASLLQRSGVQVSIGNAASDEAKLFPSEALNIDRLLQDVRNIIYWDQVPRYPINKYIKARNQENQQVKASLTSRLLIMSEVLVPQRVPKKYLRSVYVPSEEIKEQVENLLKKCKDATHIEIAVAPSLFFEPEKKVELIPGLWLAYGDMFFAGTEVLTISVNVVGVMGKGLASRFKYMFPEAYLRYEELCRSGELQVGKPYLLELSTVNGELKYKKFLLFPTKKHWRARARTEYIRHGLQYLIRNVQEGKWQFRSIALPALGCGLGKLPWETVGPLMVQTLQPLTKKGIEVMVYVPQRNPQYFHKDFYFSETVQS